MKPIPNVEDVGPLFVAQLPLDGEGRSKIRCVLVANRGEIACRVITTCRKLGVRTIAIYVQEDALSRHITAADEAINLGSVNQSGGNPYLSAEVLVRAALAARADAIHPGYGYLSENPEFAQAVRDSGLIFIGPSATSMSTLGDKRSAKAYLREHEPNVPLIPGFVGSSQSVTDFEEAAESIGYPIMLKASAGGGGKGMRIVRRQADLRGELERAQSEAARFFGSSDCILEKYIEAGKHIEIQIIGDSQGNVVSLWERECSVQRRHQKVIEETPSPWLTPQKRQEMSNTAVRIGKLLGYENAGTVEFVVDVSNGHFYFLEVNTRLQVEHCITEETTRLDIVSLQLFIAGGGNLASLPVLDVIPQRGHAIECRLCAEDPQQNFYPEHGIIRLWRQAATSLGLQSSLRFETAVETGSEVSIHFDSMIAKIVVWAPTRHQAIEKMVATLANTVCAGVRTNQLFLQSCLLHSAFSDPAYTTSFIPQNLESLLSHPNTAAFGEISPALPLAACHFLRSVGQYLPTPRRRAFANVRSNFRNQSRDPVGGAKDIVVAKSETGEKQIVLCTWAARPHLNSKSIQGQMTSLPAIADVESSSIPAMKVSAAYNAASNVVRSGDTMNARPYTVSIESCEAHVVPLPQSSASWIWASVTLAIDGKTFKVHFATESSDVGTSGITHVGSRHRVLCHVPQLGTWTDLVCYSVLNYYETLRTIVGASSQDAAKTILAPMPCKVLSVLKKNGDTVTAGESVMIVESMKMEMNISMAAGGVFETLVSKDDAVNEGVVLCRVS